MPPLYCKGLCIESPGCPGSPKFTPRVAGGLGHPPDPLPIIKMRSYDDADIFRQHNHTVLVHEAPVGEGKMVPCLKRWQHPGPVAKSIAIRREGVRRLQDEEISTFVDWKAGQHALQHIEEAVTGKFGFPN